MTKIIYINWINREIITNTEEKEQWIDEWINNQYSIYSFEEWLRAYYDSVEIYNMTTEEKATLTLQYAEYLKTTKDHYHVKAEKEFWENFEEIGIEVNKYGE